MIQLSKKNNCNDSKQQFPKLKDIEGKIQRYICCKHLNKEIIMYIEKVACFIIIVTCMRYRETFVNLPITIRTAAQDGSAFPAGIGSPQFIGGFHVLSL
jgi:hypothetical protein